MQCGLTEGFARHGHSGAQADGHTAIFKHMVLKITLVLTSNLPVGKRERVLRTTKDIRNLGTYKLKLQIISFSWCTMVEQQQKFHRKVAHSQRKAHNSHGFIAMWESCSADNCELPCFRTGGGSLDFCSALWAESWCPLFPVVQPLPPREIFLCSFSSMTTSDVCWGEALLGNCTFLEPDLSLRKVGGQSVVLSIKSSRIFLVWNYGFLGNTILPKP